jgi:hypothetical protein
MVVSHDNGPFQLDKRSEIDIANFMITIYTFARMKVAGRLFQLAKFCKYAKSTINFSWVKSMYRFGCLLTHVLRWHP